MILSDYTRALLRDIEERIDPETEDRFTADWESFWYNRSDALVFTPIRQRITPPGIPLRNIPINDALHDRELMLDMQLEDLSRRIGGRSASLCIRANYGTGIMPSLFGAEIFEMPPEMNCLPTTRSLNDSDKMRAVLEKGMPDLRNGYGADVLDFGAMCTEIFSDYPKISRYVQIYHPDTQGPLDVAELLWGSVMFYDMYDDPDFVHGVLRLITDTYAAFMDKWYSIVPEYHGLIAHWGLLHRGRLMLRLDSGMNLSPEFYREYSLPYDRELLDRYGGGCMHFCGRGSHYIDALCEIESLYAFNCSQPHLNDTDRLFDAALRNGKKIIGFPAPDVYKAYPSAKPGVIHT